MMDENGNHGDPHYVLHAVTLGFLSGLTKIKQKGKGRLSIKKNRLQPFSYKSGQVMAGVF